MAIGAPVNTFNAGHVRVYDLSETTLSTKNQQISNFKIYPNPVKGHLKIQLNPGQNLQQVNIYTVEGKYLYSKQDLEFNISNLLKGTYFIEVSTSLGKSAKKIVVE